MGVEHEQELVKVWNEKYEVGTRVRIVGVDWRFPHCVTISGAELVRGFALVTVESGGIPMTFGVRQLEVVD